MGARPPHISPSHWVFAPAVEPLLKSGGLGCAVTFSVPLRVVPAVAEIVTLKAKLLYRRYPGLVPTSKVALVCPAGTVMLGRVAANSMFELVRITTTPPSGAGALSLTVPVDALPLPPGICEGLRVTEATLGDCRPPPAPSADAQAVSGATTENKPAIRVAVSVCAVRFVTDRWRRGFIVALAREASGSAKCWRSKAA